jgi:hypothetical protein
MADGADGPVPHHARGLLQGGDVAVAEVDHVHHARLGGGCAISAAWAAIGGQRLFAQDMLARGQEGQGRRVMRGIGVTLVTASNSPQASASSTEAKPCGMPWVWLEGGAAGPGGCRSRRRG